MEILLDFVYTETVNVSVENVQELLPAACLLQLNGRFAISTNSMVGQVIFLHFRTLLECVENIQKSNKQIL